MKTLKCKNCDGLIEWHRGDGQVEDEEFIIGCPSCRQNIVYGHNEINKWIVEDTVHEPAHYNFGGIKVADFAEQVIKHYDSVKAAHIYNAIKYISRAPHKGKEDADIEKAINSLVRARTGEWKE